ncbi:MAG: peroxidase family protein [Pseudomonadota bacterium]
MEKYRSIDGSGNNTDDPTLGQTHTQLTRVSEAGYGDGISTMAGQDRPSAREVSNAVFEQTTSGGNDKQASDFLWMWGQFIDHDMSLTPASHDPDAAAPIAVPMGCPYFDPDGTGMETIRFSRSEFDETTGTGIDNPREHLNEITPYLDAGMVYGSDQVRADALRNDDGTMVMSDGDLMGFNTAGLDNEGTSDPRAFLAGDVRANENVALTSIHTLFAREHNRLVEELSAANPSWDGDTLYQEAKKLVEAQIQIITYDEFLPMLLGDDAIPEYEGYDATVDPQIATEFSTAAFRIGHTLLSSTIMRVNEDGSESQYGHLALRDAFFRPDRLIIEGGMDDILRGAAVSEAETMDTQIIDDVRNFLFGDPGDGGFDLASLNIQRGRDHGLADYNAMREAYGLDRVESFADITSDVDLQQTLKDLYGTVDNMDAYVGGLAEDPVPGSQLGELFHTVVVDQFVRTRDGDSYWYENRLTADEMLLVQDSSLGVIIERNTEIEHMQDDVFTAFDRVLLTEEGDFLYAPDEYQLIMAGAGDDTIVATTGTQQVEGEEGDDRLFLGTGDDIGRGGTGNDRLYGAEDNDRLYGEDGADALFGGTGDDRLDGGTGNDTMLGGEGRDVFVFSPGDDVVRDFARVQDTLDFMGSETVTSMEDLTFTATAAGMEIADGAGNTMLLQGITSIDGIDMQFRTGVDAAVEDPIISGEDGDYLIGTREDDTFLDTEGTQYMFGREGSDVAIFQGNAADYTVSKFGNDGVLKIETDTGFDVFFGIETFRFDDGEVAASDFDIV